MNVWQIIKKIIMRPPWVSEGDPYPVPLNNPLPLHMKLYWETGGAYKNLATCKKWVTIKSDLDDDDDDAGVIQLISDEDGDPFNVVSAARGELDCIIPSSLMNTLTAGTIYHVDVQILEDDEPYTIFKDRIQPYQQVTKAVS